MDLIKGSYNDNCIFLLKDLTGTLKEITIEEKEKLIAKGISYSNFISKEKETSESLKNLFLKLLDEKGQAVADYIGKVAEVIYENKGNDLVVVSLARAGTPYGILITKYLKFKYNVDIKHYTVSIIRGKGIDYNALKYILDEEKNANIQFVDGWTGKGSIINQLEKSIDEFNERYNKNIDSSLAVIADPAKLCPIYGTREDIAVPNSILNSTVSGLISRTILNNEYIGKDDFHGAINIDYLKGEDFSQLYIDKIASLFRNGINSADIKLEEIDKRYSDNVSNKIKDDYSVKNINNVKLSIGEATRVLLRRKARILLISDFDDEELRQLIILAKEKNVKVEKFEFSEYKAIAIIEEKE